MPPSATPDLATLVSLFYPQPALLGRLEPVEAEQMPPAFRWLLAHDEHMTVTVENFHASPVDVQVLAKRVEPPFYARKILLARRSDQQVVQFGIMRIDFSYLEPEVRAEIEAERTPLGRTLIEHNVLRRVRLAGLWRVVPGSDLQQLFGLSEPRETYGRTAIVECNGEPAVEVLEIVTPFE
jgi:chorismate-pyruvate lyase